jgi:integrase
MESVAYSDSWGSLYHYRESPRQNRCTPARSISGGFPTHTEAHDELARAAKASGIGHVSTHAFRHSYRSWLDAVGTAITVQQKMLRHTDIRTTMNVYGDVVTDEMATASQRVARLAFQTNGAQAECKAPANPM